MIPVTENTIKAVAALIYNHAYNQDPDTGWLAHDEHSAPGNEYSWLEWSKCLIEVLQEHPKASDEQVLDLAARRVDIRKASHSWNTIWMQQTETGDEYSTMTEETDIVLPLVRHFLEKPQNYVEISFIEGDPAYVAYLEAPIDEKPEITIDLTGESGNVFFMRLIAIEALEKAGMLDQSAELKRRFDELSHQPNTTYQTMRSLIAEYCTVKWLNEDAIPKP
jgi:hypothetical protein